MSYCRFWWDDSDVYVYASTEGGIVCCACLMGGGTKRFETQQEVIDHLMVHRARGHNVPEYALFRLRAERDGIPYETDVQAAIKSLEDNLARLKEPEG